MHDNPAVCLTNAQGDAHFCHKKNFDDTFSLPMVSGLTDEEFDALLPRVFQQVVQTTSLKHAYRELTWRVYVELVSEYRHMYEEDRCHVLAHPAIANFLPVPEDRVSVLPCCSPHLQKDTLYLLPAADHLGIHCFRSGNGDKGFAVINPLRVWEVHWSQPVLTNALDAALDWY
ncbi:MAG: hypothetical protein JSS66_06315 [Armatimonadetes bacterium]|nr:hypothetical protein [Armatimonadota bacterium]